MRGNHGALQHNSFLGICTLKRWKPMQKTIFHYHSLVSYILPQLCGWIMAFVCWLGPRSIVPRCHVLRGFNLSPSTLRRAFAFSSRDDSFALFVYDYSASKGWRRRSVELSRMEYRQTCGPPVAWRCWGISLMWHRTKKGKVLCDALEPSV